MHFFLRLTSYRTLLQPNDHHGKMEWMIQDPDTLANVLLFLSVQDTISLSSTNKSLSSNLPSQVKSALVDSTQSLFLCQKFPRLEKLIVTEPKQTFEKTLLQLIFNFPFLCKLSIEHIRSPFLFQKIEQLKKLKKLKLSFDTRFENLNCSFQELGIPFFSFLFFFFLFLSLLCFLVPLILNSLLFPLFFSFGFPVVPPFYFSLHSFLSLFF